MIGTFVEVPPPKTAPIDQIGETLDLVDGLHAEKSRHGQWRCACCSKMQRPDTWMVWVPDSVKRGDPDWSVTEAARRNALNGNLSGWCIGCARTLGRSARLRQSVSAGRHVIGRPRTMRLLDALCLALAAVVLYGLFVVTW